MVSAETAHEAFDRLRAVDWYGDWDVSTAHTRSRALLMREYLRRAALWAQTYGREEDWPFFDVTEWVDPSFRLEAELEGELEDFLDQKVPTPSTSRACRGVVRWAALKDRAEGSAAELPDPYQPLLLMFERGGGYSIEEFIDLYGVMIPHGTLASNRDAEPFLTLAPRTLDALDQDAVGRITYYAKTDDGHPRSRPRGIVRRRLVGREETAYDEAFTRNLRWEPTEYLRLYELGHNDVDHVQITEAEAARFIESAVARLSGAR
ncbi:hypothetical protein [Streptomyces sp. MJP52]|uniref:hypothetical protein n=1 Tax=Streptomyces sp. MJP52 TaxID=2940555 RepID=UPI002475FB5F|nr:hypothetical protein [Streptomyces sp. MJP52]MDH6227251.1 hypothetical protein [Streptomyces sp. MJP52]